MKGPNVFRKTKSTISVLFCGLGLGLVLLPILKDIEILTCIDYSFDVEKAAAKALGPPQAGNKTLVILQGSIRGGEKAWESLYRNVLDLSSADLAIVIQEEARNSKKRNSSLYKRAKYIYEFPDYDDWGDAIDLVGIQGWRDNLLASHDEGADERTSKIGSILGGVKKKNSSEKIPGSGAIIFMARWFVSQLVLEHNLLDKYDRFVVSRTDQFYACAHNVSALNPNFMYVPQGSDWGGINDRHQVCNKFQLLPSLNILPPLLEHPERYPNKWQLNTEKFLKIRWKQEKLFQQVKRIPRKIFTCADEGDTSNWAEISNETEHLFGVLLKYPQEYNDSLKNCGL